MNKQYFIYIMTNKYQGVLYTGVTSNLYRRILKHKIGIQGSFTKKYDMKLLVYFETYSDINKAIYREKQLKKWRRIWKLSLIQSKNPHWNDLFPHID